MAEEKSIATVFKKKGFFKKLIRRKIFWTILMIILIATLFLFFKFGGTAGTTVYTTEEVKKGSLVQTVSATGEVEAAENVDLSFKAAGRLVYLGVKEGDTVKGGQVLASVNTAGLLAQIAQYRASLDSAKADLKKIEAGAAAEEIKVAEEEVSKAENDLVSAQSEKNTQLLNYKGKTIDAINNGLFTASVALNVVYNHLINGSNTFYLIVDNQSILNRVENNYDAIKNDMAVVSIAMQAVNATDGEDKLMTVANQAKTLLTGVNGWLDDAYRAASEIVINNNYTQTQKDTVKTDVKTQQSTNNTSLTALETARSNLLNYADSYDAQVQAAKDNLAIARAQLALKRAGPRDFEVEAAEAKVAQAEAQLNIALADLDDYRLVAPIDGTVTAISYQVGERVGVNTPVVKMLSLGKFEIKVDIPESDVAKVKIGDRAVINLDAFGADRIFNGTIVFIDPAQTVVQDVIYYKTTIIFDPNDSNAQVKPGMSADITIKTAEKTDVIYIPQRAVRIREALLGEVPEKFVEVLVATGKTAERKVEIGLRGDNGLVEIISGLAVGEKVVTFKKNGK